MRDAQNMRDDRNSAAQGNVRLDPSFSEAVGKNDKRRDQHEPG
jgi:hypothetical protein